MPISLDSRSQLRWTRWTVRQQKPRLIAKLPSGQRRTGKLKPSDGPTRLRGKRRNSRQRLPLHNGRPGPPNRRDLTLNAKPPGHGKKKRARRRSLSGRPRQRPRRKKPRQRRRRNKRRQKARGNKPRQRPRGNKPKRRRRKNRPNSRLPPNRHGWQPSVPSNRPKQRRRKNRPNSRPPPNRPPSAPGNRPKQRRRKNGPRQKPQGNKLRQRPPSNRLKQSRRKNRPNSRPLLSRLHTKLRKQPSRRGWTPNARRRPGKKSPAKMNRIGSTF